MSSTPNKQAGYPRLVADIGGTNARFALETAPRVIEKPPCFRVKTTIRLPMRCVPI